MEKVKYYHDNFFFMMLYLRYRRLIPKIFRSIPENILFRSKGVVTNWLSLGETCLAAWILKESKLRNYSGPFDWFTGYSLKDRLEILCDGRFEEALKFEELSFGKIIENEGTIEVRNNRLKLYFPHDFKECTLVENLNVKEKYIKRLERARVKLIGGKTVFLYVGFNNDYDCSMDELSKKLIRLTKKYNMRHVYLFMMLPSDDNKQYFELANFFSSVTIVTQYYDKGDFQK